MAFGAFNRGGSASPMAEINMIPLIDVMLVLLVIFIVTAPLLTHSLRIDLPRASSTPDVTKPRARLARHRRAGPLLLHRHAERYGPHGRAGRRGGAAPAAARSASQGGQGHDLPDARRSHDDAEPSRLAEDRVRFRSARCAVSLSRAGCCRKGDDDDHPTEARAPMKEADTPSQPGAGGQRDMRAAGEPREISSQELLAEGSAVRIRHRGEIYTLRQTSNGKLILTK